MSNENKNLGDVLDAVVIYEKSNKNYGTRKNKKVLNKEKDDIEDEEVIEPEVVEDTATISARRIRSRSSSDEQVTALAESIIDGSSDRDSTKRKLAKILKQGDPIVEARATMVILARKEMEKLLRTIDAVDRIEDALLKKIENGVYDHSKDFELASLVKMLEGSMARGLTIIEKVTNNKDYEEFLLAYRDLSEIEKGENIGAVAQSKESRKAVRDVLARLRTKL